MQRQAALRHSREQKEKGGGVRRQEEQSRGTARRERGVSSLT